MDINKKYLEEKVIHQNGVLGAVLVATMLTLFLLTLHLMLVKELNGLLET